MPKYEIIICPKTEPNKKTEGDIFAIRPAGFQWGKKDKKGYLIVPAILTTAESQFLESVLFEGGKTKAEVIEYENEKLALMFPIFQKYAVVVNGQYVIPPESTANYQAEIIDLNLEKPDIQISDKHRYKFPLSIIKDKCAGFDVEKAQDLNVEYQPFLDGSQNIKIDTAINEPLFYDKYIDGFRYIPEKEIPL